MDVSGHWLVCGLHNRGVVVPFHSCSVYVMDFVHIDVYADRLCGLVVRVSGYRYRGPGFDSRRYQIF